MRDDSVFTPIEKRRNCTNFEKGRLENKVKRTMNSNIKLQEKVKELEERIIKLENLYEQYKESEIQRLKVENERLAGILACAIYKGENQ